MTHILKILDKYADSFFIGLNIFNTFEIRENDRHFHKGDYIRFRTVRNDGHPITHALDDQDYKIVYVLKCPKKNYVVLKIEKAD